MAKNNQKSKRVKIIKFLIGGFLVSFSVYRFLNISNISPLWTIYQGLAVLQSESSTY